MTLDNANHKMYVGCTSHLHKICIEANREVISWDVVRDYLDACLSNHGTHSNEGVSSVSLVAEGFLQWTPLRIASESASLDIIQKILKLEGVVGDVEDNGTSYAACISDINGMLPLHHAAIRKNLRVMNVLQKAHPDGVKKEDYWHRTPLHCIFIDYGSSLSLSSSDDSRDRFNERSYSREEYNKCYEEIVRSMLKGDVGIQATRAKDNAGRSPLHILCSCGNKNTPNKNVLRYMLERNPSSLSDKDEHGKTAEQYILENNMIDNVAKDEILSLLNNYR